MSLSGMEKIGEAILEKVRLEAQDIVKKAEEKAAGEIEKARRQRAKRREAEEDRIIAEAKVEAARILARASLAAHQAVLEAKASIVDEVISRVREVLFGAASDNASLLALIAEAVAALEPTKVKIYVSVKDRAAAQEVLRENKELAGKIAEIREHSAAGGVIAEGVDGKARVDNTYETRLETLLPRILPEIASEFFAQP